MRPIDYSTVPAEHMAEGVKLYIENGIPSGSFMTAVLENNLRAAIAHADHINIGLVPQWVIWLANNAPSMCWGSPENVENWINHKGLGGL